MSKKKVNGQVREVDAGDNREPVEQAQAALPEEPEVSGEATDQAGETPQQLMLQLEQTKDQLLRQAAEYQNYRRRTERERAEWGRRAQAQVIEPLLTVLDDFRRSLDASAQAEQQEASGPAYQALKEGLELVYQNFSDVLTKLGVEYIEAVGKPFDENQHEALMQLPAPEGTEPGVVLEEIQRGYRLGDRVLRHSRVVVAA
ncbi:MAG: nucleotide exchange factor GrpE [Rhodothermales bacterium]